MRPAPRGVESEFLAGGADRSGDAGAVDGAPLLHVLHRDNDVSGNVALHIQLHLILLERPL